MKSSKSTPSVDHKVYKRRWLMLLLFMIYAFNGSQQWAQFTAINNLVTKYYNVTTTHVEWTSNIFTLSYIILVIPSLYLIDLMVRFYLQSSQYLSIQLLTRYLIRKIKYFWQGVRYTMILGAAGITLGNWIKFFSVAPNLFHIAFIGQCCSVSFLMLTFGLLGRFTAIWFGADEISTAGVLAIMGDQVHFNRMIFQHIIKISYLICKQSFNYY